MTTPNHPIAPRYPAEYKWLTAVDPPPPTFLSPEIQQQLLSEIQALVRLEYEFFVAQQVISLIDLYALNSTYQTLAAADFLRVMYGGSGGFDEFDRAWQQQHVQTMQALIAQAHAQVLSYLKGA